MKPILFNTDMIRAILEGRKTVTRRVVKPQPENISYHGAFRGDKGPVPVAEYQNNSVVQLRFPYLPGDILYVRETWAPWSRTEGTAPVIHYKADGETLPGVKWRPSIHMPREAARISCG